MCVSQVISIVVEHHHSLLFLSVHENFEWLAEAHMAHEAGFLYGRHGVEQVFAEGVVDADVEIAHTKGCEVLEEVCALRGVYAIVLQCNLGNDSGCRNVGPLHGNA